VAKLSITGTIFVILVTFHHGYHKINFCRNLYLMQRKGGDTSTSVAILWFPKFVLWEGDDSIVFIMSDDLLNSCIRSEHPHCNHGFAFAMNDNFLYSFIHSEHPHNIHTISSVCSLNHIISIYVRDTVAFYKRKSDRHSTGFFFRACKI
jgi:hypothetical protein